MPNSLFRSQSSRLLCWGPGPFAENPDETNHRHSKFNIFSLWRRSIEESTAQSNSTLACAQRDSNSFLREAKGAIGNIKNHQFAVMRSLAAIVLLAQFLHSSAAALGKLELLGNVSGINLHNEGFIYIGAAGHDIAVAAADVFRGPAINVVAHKAC